MSLQQSAIFDEVVRFTDHLGHVEYVVEVHTSGLQLQGKIKHHSTAMNNTSPPPPLSNATESCIYKL